MKLARKNRALLLDLERALAEGENSRLSKQAVEVLGMAAELVSLSTNSDGDFAEFEVQFSKLEREISILKNFVNQDIGGAKLKCNNGVMRMTPPKPKASASKKTPTPTQARYLAFISDFNEVNGIAPSHQDLLAYFRTSPPSINDMLKRLDALGFIEREPGVARSIKVLVARSELPILPSLLGWSGRP